MTNRALFEMGFLFGGPKIAPPPPPPPPPAPPSAASASVSQAVAAQQQAAAAAAGTGFSDTLLTSGQGAAVPAGQATKTKLGD